MRTVVDVVSVADWNSKLCGKNSASFICTVNTHSNSRLFSCVTAGSITGPGTIESECNDSFKRTWIYPLSYLEKKARM